MKKLILIAVLAVAGFASAANACPSGTHPHGGTGSHHAGGTCY
ncbi:hypothetical protein [Citrobacter sp. Marseille-Q6884]|nr:hypothetical protein [Citrobacter sp. Marseille-Q6884]